MTVITILSMSLVTYLTRICGFLFLRNRDVSDRTKKVMEAAPGCVLISVIAPHFVSSHPADLISLGMTILSATRFSLLPTVIIGVSSAAILRYFL